MAESHFPVNYPVKDFRIHHIINAVNNMVRAIGEFRKLRSFGGACEGEHGPESHLYTPQDICLPWVYIQQ